MILFPPMQQIHNLKKLRDHRTFLRNNMTEEERILWSCIKNKKLGYQFYRQHGFGGYIVDFYCPAKKLVVELDGNQHLANKEYDSDRTKFLNSQGITVIRFWNNFVRSNLRDVLMEIENHFRNN